MKRVLVFCCLCFLFACSQEKGQPDYLIPKSEFVELLTEFQEAEAIVRLGFNRTTDSLIPNDSIYAAFFRGRKISAAVFDSNFNYYSNRPKEFEKMFEQVITNLSTRSAELLEKPKAHPSDSVN
ncbi:MAG: DUF4296 domain-containing protein [Flavobacteriales bacterium]|nr:DUF4296 domain-containing protein [Flavobacteriales bacterium]